MSAGHFPIGYGHVMLDEKRRQFCVESGGGKPCEQESGNSFHSKNTNRARRDVEKNTVAVGHLQLMIVTAVVFVE